MPTYTEKKDMSVTITADGTKKVRVDNIVMKDGVEMGRSGHRYTVPFDENVPSDVAAHISDRGGKQPPRPQPQEE